MTNEVFAQLIEEQTETIMLANVSKDYVFDIIDPPVVPELNSKPPRALICVLGMWLGASSASCGCSFGITLDLKTRA